MDMENFLETVRRYTHVTKIARRMVSELIDPLLMCTTPKNRTA